MLSIIDNVAAVNVAPHSGADVVICVLFQRQPDIEIVEMLSPPFSRSNAGHRKTIDSAEPDFVWVALPGVRMERWIIDNQARYRRGVSLAVGDAFSLLRGRRSFAPPGRLSKDRYLRNNPIFVFCLLWDAM